jgi:hypothetical protein
MMSGISVLAANDVMVMILIDLLSHHHHHYLHHHHRLPLRLTYQTPLQSLLSFV